MYILFVYVVFEHYFHKTVTSWEVGEWTPVIHRTKHHSVSYS